MTASRTSDTVYDNALAVGFCERLYDGSPRWYNHDWEEQHCNEVHGDKNGALGREPTVKLMIRKAHQTHHFYQEKTAFLATCIQPNCKSREWDPDSIKYSLLKSYFENKGSKYNSEFGGKGYAALKNVATGQPGKMQWECSCDDCHKKMFVFAVNAIDGKWVYMLEEAGKSLLPRYEFNLQRDSAGILYKHFQNGAFTDRNPMPFNGVFPMGKDHVKKAWHFFLSPVRLGAKALDLLSRSQQFESNYFQDIRKCHPEKHKVAYIEDLQPWSTTVKRNFSENGGLELIPLVDPFTWVAEIIDYDYVPILAAQRCMMADQDEKAKSFIAATLAGAIGTKTVLSEDRYSWKTVEDDKYNVGNNLAATPQGYFGNIAKAWLDKYEKTLSYLTQEVNYACVRSIMPTLTLGHRIVELSCQEHADQPDFLSYGVVHWQHLLKEMPYCPPGREFIKYLTSSEHAANKIPTKNILQGEGVGADSVAGKEAEGLLLHLLLNLSMGFLPGKDNPELILSNKLEQINVKPESLSFKDGIALQKLTLKIKRDLVNKYIKKYPAVLPEIDNYNIPGKAQQWQARLQYFDSITDAEDIVVFLLKVIKEKNESPTEKNYYKEASESRENVETVVKWTSWVGKKMQNHFKTKLWGEEREVFKKLESTPFHELSEKEREITLNSRALRNCRNVSTGLKVLSGPVGLLTGIFALADELGETSESLEFGDSGAAAGHAMKTVAVTLELASAFAETGALLSIAESAAWAGPVGWAASAAMLGSTIVMAYCTKTDIEAFAQHCFLGANYGTGSDGEIIQYSLPDRSWMGRITYWDFRYDEKRFRLQSLVLLRLISSFSTIVTPNQNQPGGIIQYGYIPQTAAFEVIIKTYTGGKDKPGESIEATILPNDTSKDWYCWKGKKPEYDVVKKESDNTILIGANEENWLRATNHVFEFNVRLNLYGNGSEYVPVGDNKYVKNGTEYIHTNASIVSSITVS